MLGDNKEMTCTETLKHFGLNVFQAGMSSGMQVYFVSSLEIKNLISDSVWYLTE